MLLQNIARKSSRALVSLSLALCAATTISPVVAALTPVTATICQGGIRTPHLTITSPANHTTTGFATATLTATANWVNSISIQGGAAPVTILLSNLSTETVSLNIPLSPGINTLAIIATGGCPEATDMQSFTLTYDHNTATVSRLASNSRSPALRGTVSLPGARVFLVINGHTYEATNNGDGTWTLPEGAITPDLVDGSYPVRIYTTNAAGDTILSDITQPDMLIIDTVPPTGTVTTTSSTSRSPALRGAVDSPFTTILVTINGRTYQAINNGDGTWTLPEGTIAALASGTYPITITLTDRAGNTTTIQSTLSIKANGEFGFILAPNTGFARVGHVNIPSLYLYLIALASMLAVTWRLRHRHTHQTVLPPRRQKTTRTRKHPR